MNLCGCVEAIETGKHQIHGDDLWPEPLCSSHGVGGVPGGRHNLHPRLSVQHCGKTVTQNAMAIDDQNIDGPRLDRLLQPSYSRECRLRLPTRPSLRLL